MPVPVPVPVTVTVLVHIYTVTHNTVEKRLKLPPPVQYQSCYQLLTLVAIPVWKIIQFQWDTVCTHEHNGDNATKS